MSFNKQIFNILVLRYLFTTYHDPHHPAELISYILGFILEPAFQIRCGLYHTTILHRTIGCVYMCGSITGKDFKSNTLQHIYFPKQIKEISCEASTVVAYAMDNERYTYGISEYETYCSSNELRSKINISTTYSPNKISRGTGFGLFLCEDGRICMAGGNFSFFDLPDCAKFIELEETRGITPSKVMQIGYYGASIFVLTTDGWMYSWGDNGLGQLGLGDYDWFNVPIRLDLNNIITFSCGRYHAVALDKDHNVWEWGRIGTTQNLINPKKNSLEKIVQICCGGYHTIATDIDGNVYSWGSNEYGQLGIGNYCHMINPVQLKLEAVISISCGECHTIALTLQNEIYVWGWNRNGELGLEDYENRNLPQKLEFKF